MSIKFQNGKFLTLEELKCLKGNQSLHAGFWPPRYLFLAQEGFHSLICWQVKAGKENCNITSLFGKKLSMDHGLVEPFARWTPGWRKEIPMGCLMRDFASPYQFFLELLRELGPRVESEAEFYLRHEELFRTTLDVIQRVDPGRFSRFVMEDGFFFDRKEKEKPSILLDSFPRDKLAIQTFDFYKVLAKISKNPGMSIREIPKSWGPTLDAKASTVVDTIMYASEGAEKVFTLCGAESYEYMWKNPSSKKWRGEASLLYDEVRKEVSSLPRDVIYYIVPTHAISKFVVPPQVNLGKVDTMLRFMKSMDLSRPLSGKDCDTIWNGKEMERRFMRDLIGGGDSLLAENGKFLFDLLSWSWKDSFISSGMWQVPKCIRNLPIKDVSDLWKELRDLVYGRKP